MSRITKLWKKPVFMAMVLVLPFGYQPDNPDTSAMTVGVYGGLGEAVAVLRDCSGRVTESQPYEFAEGAFGVAFSQHVDDSGTQTIFGMKGGWVEAKGVLTDSEDPADKSRDKRTAYFNPNVSVEGRDVGVGLGLIVGDVPLFATDVPFRDDGVDRSDLGVSGHMRAGSLSEVYVLLSLNENLPLYSGGGLFNMGVGYPIGSEVRLFSGISKGVQERPGLIQQATINVPDRPLQLHIAGRFGAPHGPKENSGSVGISWQSRSETGER